PGAEILGGEIFPGNLAQVVVDVAGFHVAPFAILIDVLEQLMAGDIHARFYNVGQSPVADIDLMLLATLAAEMELTLGAVQIDMTLADGREPVGIVFSGVLLVADPDQGAVEQL